MEDPVPYPAAVRDAAPHPGSRRPRVAVIDDDTLVREAVALRLPDIEVVVQAADLRSFHAAAVPPAGVDVVLLDLRLSGPDGAGVQGRTAVSELAGAGYRVLIYTNDRRPVVLAGCLAAGALGLVHKTEPIGALRSAIDVVVGDGHRISTEVAGVAEVLAHRGLLPSLPPRQVEVLQGRARGETFASIARRLHLSERTVESYMREVGLKFADYLATHSAADLERELGLAPEDLLT